jgi:ATP-dependent Zn protease
VAVKIDEEVARLVREAHERAKRIIGEHHAELENLTRALLKYEVLYSADVDMILAGKEITREPGNAQSAENNSIHPKEENHPV